LVGSKRFRERYNLSIDKLHRALELTTASGISANERAILQGVVNFNGLTAKQIMQPRTELIAVDEDLHYPQLVEMINKSGHSRFPVYEDTIDNIKGILHAKDLLPYLDKDEHFSWQTLVRRGFFVPETKKIDMLLAELQKKRYSDGHCRR
ncbi:MAG: CBS domain-containing protein, partial [Bacteroidota bacterium]